MRIRAGLLSGASLLAFLCSTLLPSVASAAPATGLSISPIRDSLEVKAGSASRHTIVVGNLLDQSLDVSLSVQQFTIVDENYDYAFKKPEFDWLSLSMNEVTLGANASRTISYDFTPPDTAAPGGYYYTVIASAVSNAGGIKSTLQAASTIYATIDGTLDKSNTFDGFNIPSVIFGSSAFYDYDTTATGNVHYYIYSKARISNAYSSSETPISAHLILPGKPRHLTGEVPMPFWPGVYSATLSYQTDANKEFSMTKRIVFIPPWSIIVVIGLIYVGYRVGAIIVRHKRRPKAKFTD